MQAIRGLAAVAVALVGTSVAQARSGEDLTRAKESFAAGVDAYDQAHYEEALRRFQTAHALSHSPALYFNMAACEEHLDHFEAAALLLRQYLIEKPDADDRGNVEVRIQALQQRDEQLKRKMAEAPPATTTTPPAPATVTATPEPARKPALKATWALVGVTGAIGIAAIGVGAYTVTHHNSLKSGCGATAAGCSTGEVSALKSTAVATDVLIGLTAAAAVATVVVAVVEWRHGRAHAERPARLALAADGVRF
jgi:hypothetical protein